MEPFKDSYGILELVANGETNNDSEGFDEIEFLVEVNQRAAKFQLFLSEPEHHYK